MLPWPGARANPGITGIGIGKDSTSCSKCLLGVFTSELVGDLRDVWTLKCSSMRLRLP